MAKVEIGDWVTQYYSGIWQVTEMHPTYATFSYELDTGSKRPKSVQKGDITGTTVVMKQAFTSGFKFKTGVSSCDICFCKRVPQTTAKRIAAYFAEHPDHERKFRELPAEAPYSITSLTVVLNDEHGDAPDLGLEPPFTKEQVKARLKELGIEEVMLGAQNAWLYLESHPWDVTDGFDQLYRNYRFKKN